MDGIRLQTEHHAPAIAGRRATSVPAPVFSPLAINPAAVKSTSSYVQALGRRFWLVLAVAVPMAVTSAIMVLKMPPVYMAKAEIEINPPEVDSGLSALVTHDPGRRDPASSSNYVSNHEAWLRTKWLAEEVMRDQSIAADAGQHADPAAEFFRTLSVQRIKTTNSFVVSLEGTDPARTKKLLELLLYEFKKQATREITDKLDNTATYAESHLKDLRDSAAALDREIETILKKTRTIGPGGRNILEERYANLGTMMANRQVRLNELNQQIMMSQIFPKLDTDPATHARSARIAELMLKKRQAEHHLEDIMHGARNPNQDPAARKMSRILDGLMDEIQELRAIHTPHIRPPTELILDQFRREDEADRAEQQALLAELQATLPDDLATRAKLRDREDKQKQIGRMEEKLREFDILKNSVINSDCVKIPSSVVEPTVPIKPSRPMLIALGLFASLGLGIGLVCLLEHIDHSVKVPEHVSHGLTLPLLGVVPRIRRTALTHRGGHLWTPAAPDSVEADAYRNVRASLLGVADKHGPIVTLLVTSAKAGEGKSTTALNLAATCAKAGERTLLLDVDLRRPSLAEVFIEDEPDAEIHGLVDVLKGELPWQCTVRHTEIPNLDFIPTGLTQSIPIEILGTLELRQLLVALAHHYDRVILDGPAVLGLADCRVLGRMVDASLLVVRSGSLELTALHRAKAMLEQSHVELAGVVFNGLTHDINNWSSYGYEPASLAAGKLDRQIMGAEQLALAATGS
jgi:capsular exopolysaccharide synthesis family protein